MFLVLNFNKLFNNFLNLGKILTVLKISKNQKYFIYFKKVWAKALASASELRTPYL
jgi:hypothetical protein